MKSKILIVDDEIQICDVIKRALDREGYESYKVFCEVKFLNVECEIKTVGDCFGT